MVDSLILVNSDRYFFVAVLLMIAKCDGKTAKHIESNGKVIKEILPLPAFINGKFIDELTLEEFMEWERSFHCVEGKRRFDQGEGGDG